MSTRKVAVIVIHGIGTENIAYADKLCDGLRERTRAECGDGIELLPINWHRLLDATETELLLRAGQGGAMRYQPIRRFLIDFVGDAFAYQPALREKTIYNQIHGLIASALRKLAQDAGADAPLCIIAHSLGSVIASNYVYDLQTHPIRTIIDDDVRAQMSLIPTPLEKGETLALFYTLGSPIAIFSLRYHDPRFGRPIVMPPPALHSHHPGLFSEWINYYDPDDVVGYPLRGLNDAYFNAVTEDRAINVGGALASMTPLSHLEYWHDTDLLDPIARSLAQVWVQINEQG